MKISIPHITALEDNFDEYTCQEKKVSIAPSILSADPLHLAQEIEKITNADYIHIDVMDGSFVPNQCFGPNIVKAIHEITDIPLDVHLMVDNPNDVVDQYLDAGASIISFHYEAATHHARLVQHIQQRGAQASVAINPGTSVCQIDALLEYVDMVLVMTVNPGFGGQKFIPQTINKIKRLVQSCEGFNIQPLIEVDGGISQQTAQECVRAGADILVAGSAIFGSDQPAQAIQALHQAACIQE